MERRRPDSRPACLPTSSRKCHSDPRQVLRPTTRQNIWVTCYETREDAAFLLNMGSNVRFGSLLDILTSPRHVRFTRNNGPIRLDATAAAVCANLARPLSFLG